jgi:hypothetical protein
VSQPKRPTWGAFGRASTRSLGSIAFGSLIVTILEILRLLMQAFQNAASEDGNRQFDNIMLFIDLKLKMSPV